MAISSTGRIETASASRYLQQLCKHWAHKFDVTFDESQGTVPFPNGAIARLSADPEGLTIAIDAPDPEALERMKTVVVEHLDRFAFREAPLAANWN